ncbi:MAG: DUF4230 domain-containing protein [Spirochaetaceae bacterium]
MGRVISITVTAFLILLTGCDNRRDDSTLSSLESRINTLLELHTVEYVYRDVVYFGEQEYLLGLFRTRDQQLLFALEIRVQAGLDLEDGVELLRDPDDPELLLLILPAAEVLLVDAVEESIEQFFVRERGGSIEWDQVSGEMEAVKDRVRRDAVEKGILNRAEENARELATELMELAGFEQVQVEFRPARELRG